MRLDDHVKLKAAPGASRCCDAAGRMCALAVRPIPVATLIARARANGEGTREQIEARIVDMYACGLLIDSE